jgi:uncharacterized membrane protein YsdA (DUF1294 family)
MVSVDPRLLAGLYLLLVNLAAYTAFASDKRRAELRLRRIPEARLLFLCAIGGSPAGFVAQRVKRHKTRKRSFQIEFWIVVAVQVASLGAAAVLLQRM